MTVVPKLTTAQTTAVTDSDLHRLKVYTEEAPEVVRPEPEGVASLPGLLDAFGRATGWSLDFVPGPCADLPAGLTWSAPVNPGVGVPLGHLRLEPAEAAPGTASPRRVDGATAQDLAAAVAGLLGELLHTQHALWRREAELAAGVPVVAHPKEKKHLAVRLQAVLRGGAEAVGAHAAALYLLDEATTELKLRSAWGFPAAKLAAPARPLQGALADLEALLGHAVVLESPEIMRHWSVPEQGFAAAVCVPVSTSTTLLGTLWVFSKAKRAFAPQQTGVLEIVAGRIASDLEREVLVREGLAGAAVKRQLAAARRWQRHQLPTVPPLLDGWNVAGWTERAGEVGGDFFDWFCLDDGRLAVAVGDAMDGGVDAALAAAALKTAVRCHGRSGPQPDRLLRQVNLTVWTGSAGDQSASLFFGLFDTGAGRVRYAAAGQPSIVLLRPDGWKPLSRATPPLGQGPETLFRPHQRRLRPGEALLVFTDGVRDALDERGRPLGEAGLAEPLCAHLDLSAEKLAALARDRLQAHALPPQRGDGTVLVVKRAQS